MKKRWLQLLVAGLEAALISLAAYGCGSSSAPSSTQPSVATSTANATRAPGTGKPAVTLATKNFTEELILGQLYAQALRAKGFSVALKSNIGDSELVNRKLAAGAIDGYPEYTGTILSVLGHDLRRPPSANVAFARAAAYEQGHGNVLLAMSPAADTDVLIVKPAFASQHGLSSLADLARLGASATLAGPPEFRTRFDGLVGLGQAYGVRGLRFTPVKIGEQYRALDDGRAQVAVAFTTDGQLSQGGFTLLSDPQNIFGFQNVAFVLRKPLLTREGPAFAPTINSVTSKLSTQALRVMNAAVDLDQQSPAVVARQFLAANGLM